MKILPKVYANNKSIVRNNKIYSYSKNDIVKTDVKTKINNIFKKNELVYSVDCLIKFEDKEEKYTIIGVTSNHLITDKRKLISISDIYDIELIS